MDMSGMLTIRKAQPEDYDDVMVINTNLFQGLDYLAGLYHTFLTIPRNYPYVGLVDGRIVAFMMMYLIDGGTSVISKANRIKTEYAGKHLFADFRRQVLADIVKKQTSVKYVASTTLDQDNVEKLTSRNLMTVSSKSHRVAMEFQPDTLKQVLHSPLWASISSKYGDKSRVLTTSGAVDALCSLNPEHFIPDGRWLVNLDPFKPMRSNYETLIADHKSTVVIAHNQENPSDILSLTFGMQYKIAQGFKYNISFYYNHVLLAGNQNEIQNQVLSHVIKHLILINQMEAKCKEVQFWLYLEENFDVEPIKRFLSEDLEFDEYAGDFGGPLILCEQRIDDIK